MNTSLKSYGVRDEREKIPEVMATTGVHSRGDAPCDTGNRAKELMPDESGHSWHPVLFEFYYGRFSGDSCYARWDGEKILFEQTGGGNFSSGTREITPSDNEWRVFFETISFIGCTGWQSEYLSPHGCCGVTYWHLRIKYRGLLVNSRGEDAFPETSGQFDSGGFMAFLAVFRLLIAAGKGTEK